MVILHIANIKNNLFSGVCVVVPQHVIAQQSREKVAFINISNEKIDAIDAQLTFQKPFRLKSLSAPFNKPDIVVFHEVYYPEYISISREVKRQGIPYVIVPHGCLTKMAQSKKKLKKKVGNLLLFNEYIYGSRSVQCLSEYECTETKFNVNKTIGTNGIHIPNMKKESFHRDRVRFVYIGRLDAYHKGLDILLDAFQNKAELLKRNHCTLEIYGPDQNGEHKAIETMIMNRKLNDFVELHREIAGEDKKKVLLEADVFIQTSRFEGMPMGILEALSYGLPCLITQGTTLGEKVSQSDAGWVAETSVESVCEALENVVSDREQWEKKSSNAVGLIEDEFSWDKVVGGTIKLYEELAEVK